MENGDISPEVKRTLAWVWFVILGIPAIVIVVVCVIGLTVGFDS